MDSSLHPNDAVGMAAGFDPLHYLPDLNAVPQVTGAAPVASAAATASGAAASSTGGVTLGSLSPSSIVSFLYSLVTDPLGTSKNVAALGLLLLFGILFIVGGAYILVNQGGD